MGLEPSGYQWPICFIDTAHIHSRASTLIPLGNDKVLSLPLSAISMGFNFNSVYEPHAGQKSSFSFLTRATEAHTQKKIEQLPMDFNE